MILCYSLRYRNSKGLPQGDQRMLHRISEPFSFPVKWGQADGARSYILSN